MTTDDKERVLTFRNNVLGLARTCGANGLSAKDTFAVCLSLMATLGRAVNMTREEFLRGIEDYYDQTVDASVVEEVIQALREGAELGKLVFSQERGGAIVH